VCADVGAYTRCVWMAWALLARRALVAPGTVAWPEYILE
jgi:hypothetical protein